MYCITSLGLSVANHLSRCVLSVQLLPLVFFSELQWSHCIISGKVGKQVLPKVVVVQILVDLINL